MSTSDSLVLDGASLSLSDIVRVARSKPGETAVSLSETARSATQELRDYLEQHWLTDDAPAIMESTPGWDG